MPSSTSFSELDDSSNPPSLRRPRVPPLHNGCSLRESAIRRPRWRAPALQLVLKPQRHHTVLRLKMRMPVPTRARASITFGRSDRDMRGCASAGLGLYVCLGGERFGARRRPALPVDEWGLRSCLRCSRWLWEQQTDLCGQWYVVGRMVDCAVISLVCNHKGRFVEFPLSSSFERIDPNDRAVGECHKEQHTFLVFARPTSDQHYRVQVAFSTKQLLFSVQSLFCPHH
ncbi:hypothetical protein BJ546DRAFT_499221 [Cryomyces antarcticus]